MIIKDFLKKIFHFIFRYRILKSRYNELTNKYNTLNNQFEYLKRHSDITLLKPAIGLLREYQKKELVFASEIIEILNSKNIYPFFDGGCLLGALRHKGFVPWDDDVDLGVLREDFEKIIQIAKNQYIWLEFNNTSKDANQTKFIDEALKQYNDKYIFFMTPYCIHCYKGKSINDAVNIEFFPYDYVKPGITKEDYLQYIQFVKTQVIINHPWKEIYNFYNQQLDEGKYLTREITSRIVPGLGNYALTEYSFNDFLNYSDIYPLGFMDFEDKSIPVPNNAKKRVENLFKNWNKYPKDVGISHDMDNKKNFYLQNGISFNDEDFLF